MSKNFKLNLAGFRELRNSPEVQRRLAEAAKRVADASGTGYASDVQTGKNRARAGVVTATAEAMVDNARNNTLLRNLGAGRG